MRGETTRDIGETDKRLLGIAADMVSRLALANDNRWCMGIFSTGSSTHTRQSPVVPNALLPTDFSSAILLTKGITRGIIVIGGDIGIGGKLPVARGDTASCAIKLCGLMSGMSRESRISFTDMGMACAVSATSAK